MWSGCILNSQNWYDSKVSTCDSADKGWASATNTSPATMTLRGIGDSNVSAVVTWYDSDVGVEYKTYEQYSLAFDGQCSRILFHY